MKHARSLVLLSASLTLLVTACSQPDNLTPPELASQFGTTYADSADAVVNDPQRGYAYVAGVAAADLYEEGGRIIYLRRYNENGSLAWERRTSAGRYDPGSYPDIYYPLVPFVNAVQLDGAGNVYIGYSKVEGNEYAPEGGFISKLNPAGKLLYKVGINDGIADFEVDAAGSIYVAGFSGGNHPEGANERYFLRKYDPQGRLVWERARVYDDEGQLENPTQTIPAPLDIGLGSDGSLYVVGVRSNCCSSESNGSALTKYSSAGATLWEQTRPAGWAVLTAAGQAFYLATNTDGRTLFQKYGANGALLWQKAMVGYTTTAIAVNTSGNAFLAGEVGDDLFARKYTSSGVLRWTYQPRLAGTYESALGISAKDGSNIYLAGVTDGKVNGRNVGGTDAFLMRLNGQGQKVWSR